MARQSRTAAAAAATAAEEEQVDEQQPQQQDEDEEVEVEQGESANTVLTFNEPLSWKAGKAISIGTLVDRLKALTAELQELEQEDVDRDSLATAAKELAAPNLLQHKDEGVRAHVACCLADMLRLHAPDAPYTAQQLKVEMCSRTVPALS